MGLRGSDAPAAGKKGADGKAGEGSELLSFSFPGFLLAEPQHREVLLYTKLSSVMFLRSGCFDFCTEMFMGQCNHSDHDCIHHRERQALILLQFFFNPGWGKGVIF